MTSSSQPRSRKNVKRGKNGQPPRMAISLRMEQAMKQQIELVLAGSPTSINQYILEVVAEDLARRVRYRWLNVDPPPSE